jgi:hypothetical protein
MSTPERQQDQDPEKTGGYGGTGAADRPEGAELVDFEPDVDDDDDDEDGPSGA